MKAISILKPPILYCNGRINYMEKLLYYLIRLTTVKKAEIGMQPFSLSIN